MGGFTTGAQLTSSILGGAAGTAAGIAAMTGTATAAGLGLGLATAPATLGVGAAVAGLVALFSRLFTGADPRQVPASQIEQAIEAAADNLYAVCKMGMISITEAVSGMQALLQKGVATLQSSGLGMAAQNGIDNLVKVVNAEIAVTQQLNSSATAPIDLEKAHSVYIRQQAGWYPQSVDAATQLTDQYLQGLPTRFSDAVNMVTNAGGSLVQSLGSILGIGESAASATSQPAASGKTSPALIIGGLGLGFFVLRRIL